MTVPSFEQTVYDIIWKRSYYKYYMFKVQYHILIEIANILWVLGTLNISNDILLNKVQKYGTHTCKDTMKSCYKIME